MSQKKYKFGTNSNVMKSVKEQIKSKIQRLDKGQIILPSDYEIEFGIENTKKSLQRLTNEGFLERLSRGIYLYPERDEILGVLYPTIETIVKKIADRDGARFIPTGSASLNYLGLSKQVPMNVVYLTDGSPRNIAIKNHMIKFKKTSPANLALKGRVTSLVLHALKEIGKDKVTKSQINEIKERLKSEDTKIIRHDMKFAPSWIATIFADLINGNDE